MCQGWLLPPWAEGQRLMGTPGPRLVPGTSEGEGLPAPPCPPLECLAPISPSGCWHWAWPASGCILQCPPLLSLGRGDHRHTVPAEAGRPAGTSPPHCLLGFASVKVVLLRTSSHRARGAVGKWSQLAASSSAWQGSALCSPVDAAGRKAPYLPLRLWKRHASALRRWSGHYTRIRLLEGQTSVPPTC